MKKYRLKKWVLYLIFIILFSLFFLVCSKLQLIYIISNNELDITKLIIFIISYEILKANIKAIIKREKQENN